MNISQYGLNTVRCYFLKEMGEEAPGSWGVLSVFIIKYVYKNTNINVDDEIMGVLYQ